MNRRNLIISFALGSVLPVRGASRLFKEESTEDVFKRLMLFAVRNKWNELPIGELMTKLGSELKGTPYVAGTLEADGPESCRIDLTGLDCVTFFEDVLAMARIIKKNKATYEDLVKEITFTRYRDGQLNGYVSRLHYTSEWISNNVAKGVVKDVTPEMGGIPFPVNVNFMSRHPKYYQPLATSSEMVDEIKIIEMKINSTPRTYIPKEAIAKAESLMQSGDIIAVATSKEGLDYSHTGMISKGADGVAHFMHASTTQKKVVLDKSISEYVAGVKAHIGVTVVRPIDF